MTSKSRIISLILLLIIGAFFLFDFSPRKHVRNTPQVPGETQQTAESGLKSAGQPRRKLPNVAGQDFTLNELLNFPGQPPENETTDDPSQQAEGLAQALTVRARGLESGSTAARGQYGDGSGGDGSSFSSPELDALREIENAYQPRGSSLIPGAQVRGAVLPTVAATIDVQPIASPTPQGELERVSGQARGYTMLYLMQPGARRTVDAQVEIMLRSQVNDLYLGVLTDGTFSRDFAYLSDVLRRLSRANRSVTLVLYLTNGATMRAFATTTSEAGFNKINPTDFRGLIRFDAATREKFIRLVRPVIPILQLNRRLNQRSRNFVAVMLEDNLDDDSYLAMRRLADNIIGDRAVFLRNPCPGCWEGNTAGSLGDALELHTPDSVEALGSRDGYSLDGFGYHLPGEAGEGALDFEEAKDLIITSASRGLRWFGLWRFQRQGLAFGTAPTPVDQRVYEVPDEIAALAEIELLRAGLVPPA